MTPRRIETNIAFTNLRDSRQAVLTDLRPRFRWSRGLNELFIEAVNQLGGPKEATPKHIKDLMDIQEVTLCRVKSHLQRYRMSQPANIKSYSRQLPGSAATNKVNAGNIKNGGDTSFELNLNENAHVSGAPYMKTNKQGRFQKNLKLDLWSQERDACLVTQPQAKNIRDDPLEHAMEVMPKVPKPFQVLNKGSEYQPLTFSSCSCSRIDEEDQHNLKRDHRFNTETDIWSSPYKIKSIHISEPHPPCLNENRIITEEPKLQQNLDLIIGLPGIRNIDRCSRFSRDELKFEENNSRKYNLPVFAIQKPRENIMHMQILARDDKTSEAKSMALTDKGFDLNVSACDEELRTERNVW